MAVLSWWIMICQVNSDNERDLKDELGDAVL